MNHRAPSWGEWSGRRETTGAVERLSTKRVPLGWDLAARQTREWGAHALTRPSGRRLDNPRHDRARRHIAGTREGVYHPASRSHETTLATPRAARHSFPRRPHPRGHGDAAVARGISLGPDDLGASGPGHSSYCCHDRTSRIVWASRTGRYGPRASATERLAARAVRSEVPPSHPPPLGLRFVSGF